MANPLMLLVALAVATVVTQAVLAPFLGITGVTLTTAFLIGTAIVFGLKLLNIGRSFNSFTAPYSAAIAVIALVAAFGVFGNVGGIQPVKLQSQPASIAAPASVAAGTVSSLSQCESGVPPETRGTSATVTLNAYNLEVDSPFAAAVDAGTVYIYKAARLSDGNTANFISSVSDTTANGVTGFKTGDVISMAGGNASFFVETKEGVCLTGQQNPVNLDAHGIVAPTSMQNIVYDSTGATELGAGTNGNRYARALGASEEQAFFMTVKVNTSNAGIWLAGIATAKGINITSVMPGGNSVGLFEEAVSPDFLQNVVLNTSNNAAATDVTVRKDFAVYKLKSPRILHEFEEYKFQFNIKSSSNDPVGAVNTTTYSGVWITALDQGYARGADGKMYLDIHDHSTNKANVGMNELLVPLNLGRTGSQIDVT